jgi:lipopolysaccharide/colanic/teichoic acid biosynthesis glycosyltransferase
MFSLFIKRALDLLGASALLLLIWPVLLLIYSAVRMTIGSPVIFRQTRPGLSGKPFTIYKFRTMSDDRDAAGKLLADDKRMTALGTLLRNLSLDELPTLLNVLKGDMSFVGPRPLVMQYLERYSPEQARRHQVLPGITGWAQINGRNAITWEEKFALDVWYVDNQSFKLDVCILAMTIWKVVRREGVSAPGHVTAFEFMGSPAANPEKDGPSSSIQRE